MCVFVGENESQPSVFHLLVCEDPPVISPSPGSVDFPPVAINVDLNGHIGFDFKHPWLLYGSKLPPAKSRQKKSNKEKIPTRIPEFTYTVKVNEVRMLLHPWKTVWGLMP